MFRSLGPFAAFSYELRDSDNGQKTDFTQGPQVLSWFSLGFSFGALQPSQRRARSPRVPY